MNYPNEEVNHTELFPSVCNPWFVPSSYFEPSLIFAVNTKSEVPKGANVDLKC